MVQHNGADWIPAGDPTFQDDVFINGGEADLNPGDAGFTVASITQSGQPTLLGVLDIAIPGATQSVFSQVLINGSGYLGVDAAGEGGSSLSIGGLLTNFGDFFIGNSGISAATTVTAGALENLGTITIVGSTTKQAVLTTDFSAATFGTITLAGSSELVVGTTFIENAGTTTVNAGGTLAAPTIFVTGGLLDFTSAIAAGSGAGNFEIGGGVVEFGGAVDAGHSMTFTSAAGVLELGAPGQFAPTIDGFSTGDTIDLLQTRRPASPMRTTC